MRSEDDLYRAIAWVAEKMQRHGLQVTVHDKDVGKVLSEEALTVTYQVVQEFLYNVAKHAKCRQAIVTLERSGDYLKASVTDEGIGFNVSAGRGLLNIQERVTPFGGRVEICSQPGKGTCATIFMPLLIATPVKSHPVDSSNNVNGPGEDRKTTVRSTRPCSTG